MSTITPGRLYDITNSSDALTLIEQNNEILTEEVFKQVPTYQNGVPNQLPRPLAPPDRDGDAAHGVVPLGVPLQQLPEPRRRRPTVHPRRRG